MNKQTLHASSPLFDALVKHDALNNSSFHTPGHKGNCPFLCADPSLDLTELPDTDSLFASSGCIRDAEVLAARCFGAAYSAFSAGGCTLAIQGMLAAFAPPGSKVIFGRNVHRAAVNAAALLRYDPVWVLHRRDGGPFLPGRLSPDDVRAALQSHPDAAAVYLTSPDYFGCLSDIRGIAGVCREFHTPLLVDNAHGSHLIAFGLHPITLGASASACSAHKTLPVLTGGAWLHCADERFIPRVKPAMALFGSTSPSYLTMASLDLARLWLERGGAEELGSLAVKVAHLRHAALGAGFGLPSGECDPVRLTLLTRPLGLTGTQAAAFFRENGMEPEYADDAAVVFIPTPFNTNCQLADLGAVIREFPRSAPLPDPDDPPFTLPECVLSPAGALERPCESVPVGNSAGRIAAEAACPCPPGVPVVIPGEKISENCVNILLKTGIQRINVIK